MDVRWWLAMYFHQLTVDIDGMGYWLKGCFWNPSITCGFTQGIYTCKWHRKNLFESSGGSHRDNQCFMALYAIIV